MLGKRDEYIALQLNVVPHRVCGDYWHCYESGFVMPIRCHFGSSETCLCFRGHYQEYESGKLTQTIDMLQGGVIVNVPIGQWLNLKSIGLGTVLLSFKDGKYELLREEILTGSLGVFFRKHF